MKARPKKGKDITWNGRVITPSPNYGELLDLLVYQAYRSGSNHFNVSYAVVNICLLILQNEKNAQKKDLCQRFMVFAFRSFIRKWVMKNYNRIRKYFNMSIQGMHQDMMDVYQEVYICFFDLIYKFNTKKDVYFVIYLNKYLFYWLNNRYKINKKEQITMLSLNSVVTDAEDNSQITLIDALQAVNAKSITNPDDSNDLEEKMIHRFMMQDFETRIINNEKNFKTKRIQKTYTKVYTYFFVEGKSNKADLARQMRISQQKVRYYLDKISRMFYAYMKDV